MAEEGGEAPLLAHPSKQGAHTQLERELRLAGRRPPCERLPEDGRGFARVAWAPYLAPTSQQTENTHSPAPQNEAQHVLCAISIFSDKLRESEGERRAKAAKQGRGGGRWMDGYPACSE